MLDMIMMDLGAIPAQAAPVGRKFDFDQQPVVPPLAPVDPAILARKLNAVRDTLGSVKTWVWARDL